MSKNSIITTIAVCVAIIVGAWFIGRGIKHFREGYAKISVTGACERNIVSDLIVWKLSFNSRTRSTQDAFMKIEKDTKIIVDYLKEQGIAPEEIVVRPVSIAEDIQTVWETGKRTSYGYVGLRTIEVKSAEVSNVERVYQNISDLYNQGVDLASETPNYYYTKLNELKMEMLREASADARERALTIAEGSGSSLGKAISSSMGVFQIVALHGNDEYSWGGTLNTKSREKTATITVKTVYKLQ